MKKYVLFLLVVFMASCSGSSIEGSYEDERGNILYICETGKQDVSGFQVVNKSAYRSGGYKYQILGTLTVSDDGTAFFKPIKNVRMTDGFDGLPLLEGKTEFRKTDNGLVINGEEWERAEPQDETEETMMKAACVLIRHTVGLVEAKQTK